MVSSRRQMSARLLQRGTAWGLIPFFVLLPGILDAASAKPAQARATSPQFEALPLIRSKQNHLLVRAVINGREAWLGVDSGAPVSAISVNRRQHFRLTGIPTSSN